MQALGEPSRKVRARARAMIVAAGGPVQEGGDNPLLDAAAEVVAGNLDDYDRAQIAKVAQEPPDSPERRSLELAFAHRFVVAALELGAAMEELLDPPAPGGD